MRLLLDAPVSRRVWNHLQSLGVDCVHAGLLPPGTTDRALMELAAREGRVIVTSDKDFGELVFRWKLNTAGVVLLRLRGASESGRTARFIELWPHIEKAAPDHFVTVTNRRIRRTPLPDP